MSTPSYVTSSTPVLDPKKSTDWWKIIPLLALVVTIMVQGPGLWKSINSIKHYLEAHHQPPVQDKSIFIIHLFQLGIICIVTYLIWDRFWDGGVMPDVNDTSQSKFRAFRSSWILVFASWMLLYIWLTLRTGFLASSVWNEWLDSVTDAGNVLNGFTIWHCFVVLDNGDDEAVQQKTRTAFWGGVFCACFSCIDRVFQCGHVGLAFVGVYTGLAIACLAWRLGSHFIKLQSSLIISLHLYAMIRVFYAFFDLLPRPWPWMIFIACLALKILLSIAGFQMLKSGGIGRYFKAQGLNFPVTPRLS